MRVITASAIVFALAIVFTAAPKAQNPAQNPAPVTNAPGIPGWAYPVAAGVPGPKDDGTVFHVPNSTVGMTLTQARNNSDVPDCHYPNGLGRPENASIAGLPMEYFIGPGAKLMKPVVANLTVQDMVAIAAYVSSRSPEPSKSTTTARR